MLAVHETQRELGGRDLWPGMWERNPRASFFCSKAGFSCVGSNDFFVSTDRQTDRVFFLLSGSQTAAPFKPSLKRARSDFPGGIAASLVPAYPTASLRRIFPGSHRAWISICTGPIA